MIVIASDDPGVMSEISTLLKQRGDLFTVATDEIQTLDAIRADRASLLIIDTGASAFDGISLCRTIKNDTALQELPVLCLVDLADISALLSVLDCTADSFLTRPFDLASLSAAISDLQARQAEGVAPVTVRTRYRINHDGKEYSVVADRRQLLEHLLTAFESAVRVNAEKERMRSDLLGEVRTVNERLTALTAERDATVTNLHEDLEERNRAISRLNGEIQIKEQAEALLKTRMENVAQELKDLGALLETTRRSEEEKSRMISMLQTDFGTLKTDKARIEQELKGTILDLETRLKDTISELDAARSTVAGLRVNNAELERVLSSVQAECEQGKATRESLEEKLKAAISSRDEWQEKYRKLQLDLEQAQTASAAREQEVRTSLDNVTRDLNGIQDALEQNLRQLERELAMKKQLEQQVESLAKERDSLSRTRDEWQEKCRKLQLDLEQAQTTSAFKEREVKTALDNVTSDMHAMQNALEQNIRQLEQELAKRQELEEQTTILSRERDELSRTGEDLAKRLAEVQAQLEYEREVCARLQTECDAINSEHERTQDVLGTTYNELERIKEKNRSLQEMQDSSMQSAREVAELRRQLDAITANLASERSALKEEKQQREKAEEELTAISGMFADAKKSLDSAMQDVRVLNKTVEEEREKRAALEERLTITEKELHDKDRAIKVLRDELDAVRSAEPAGIPLPSSWGAQEVPIPPPVEKPVDHKHAEQAPLTEPRDPTMQSGMGSGQVTTDVKPDNDPLLPPPPSYQKTLPATGPAAALPGAEAPQKLPESGPGSQAGSGKDTDPAPVTESSQVAAGATPLPRPPSGDIVISRDRWLDITKWAHHTDSVTEEQRKDLIANLMRLSKLVQKGRHLTNRQEQEIRALIARVQSLGYRFV
ncbi:MAG: DNA-binding response regulator CreB [Methanoregula sp. PtaU1.Bin051]|nr:MAG: DNA-binding response regulator CreB [Methanoregula sp. PtaU1.Bin051]